MKEADFKRILRFAISGTNSILFSLLVIHYAGYAQENLGVLNIRLQKEIWPAS